jgi:hypothetical protein
MQAALNTALYGTVVKGRYLHKECSLQLLLPSRRQCIYQQIICLKTNTSHTCRGVIGSVPSPPLLHNPTSLQSIGKECWLLRHCIRQNRSGTIWSEAYIIWISRSYRKTCCATVCWRQQMIAFATTVCKTQLLLD